MKKERAPLTISRGEPYDVGEISFAVNRQTEARD